MQYTLHTDGGSRGNPGPSGIGFTIEQIDDTNESASTIICRGGAYIGETTNNQAEYRALIWGLSNARELGINDITIRADSELMVRQIQGAYRVKNAGLKPLFNQVMQLLDAFDTYDIDHVMRSGNKDADALVNEAMDKKDTVGDFKINEGDTCTRLL
ncbi:MAG: ribonuclease HI family protein [Coriobacteriales bacterium]|jgi:ribonuclease HI|nr:ribonuclease HI family protein [Coriobacteriales bacterium]